MKAAGEKPVRVLAQRAGRCARTLFFVVGLGLLVPRSVALVVGGGVASFAFPLPFPLPLAIALLALVGVGIVATAIGAAGLVCSVSTAATRGLGWPRRKLCSDCLLDVLSAAAVRRKSFCKVTVFMCAETARRMACVPCPAAGGGASSALAAMMLEICSAGMPVSACNKALEARSSSESLKCLTSMRVCNSRPWIVQTSPAVRNWPSMAQVSFSLSGSVNLMKSAVVTASDFSVSEKRLTRSGRCSCNSLLTMAARCSGRVPFFSFTFLADVVGTGAGQR